MSFDDFKKKFGVGQNFKNLTSKEKDRLYNEMMEPIKKAAARST